MTETNADQRAFWNDAPGQRWVEHQALLDELHAEPLAVLIGAAALEPGARVLDIGCGAGGSCLAALDAMAGRGQVLGLDISEPLVALARARVVAAGAADRIEIRLADAQTEVVDARVDTVISRFGVMFFDDPVAAFGNIRAAIRPGGRLDAVCWAGPENNPWFTLPLAAAVERLGPAQPAAPDAPGPMALRDTGRTSALLREAGFAEAAATAHDVTLRLAGGLEAAAPLLTRIGPIARHLREKGGTPEDLAAIRDAVLEQFRPFAAGGPLEVPARVLHYQAITPP